MPALQISKELSGYIATKFRKIKFTNQTEIDSFLKNDTDFQNIVNTAKKILDSSLFVVIKNIGFNKEKKIFEAFVKLFGEFYGAVEYTDIRIEPLCTGSDYEAIKLHNDDAIDLKNQPKTGFIQVINEDPLKSTRNGVVRIDDIVRYLEIYDANFLDKLFKHKIPMLSYGVNYDGQNKEEIITKQPVLYKENNENKVRFDLTRIDYYYWKKQITQTIEEKLLLDKFLNIAKKFRHEFYLAAGDILITHNKRTLHDRTGCSLELKNDGSFNTREIFVSFTRG